MSDSARMWIELGLMAALLAATLFVLVVSDVEDVGFGLLGLIVVEGLTLLVTAATAESIRAQQDHLFPWAVYAVIACVAIAGAVKITIMNRWKIAGSVTVAFIAVTAISGMAGWTSVIN